MICQSNESHEREVANTQALISSRVDGLIVSVSSGSQQFGHFERLHEKGIPLVFFDRICENMATSRVIVDDYEGAYMAVEHLLAVGCRRIAHLAGPPSLLITHNRLKGYLDALSHNNQPIDPQLIVNCDTTLKNGLAGAKQLLEQTNGEVDGIFAAIDMVAIGAMMAIKEKGLRIPDDIAVLGFANNQYAPLFEPSLTSIEQPAFEMGQTATRLFLRQVADTEAPPVTKVLKTQLVIRNSSKRQAAYH